MSQNIKLQVLTDIKNTINEFSKIESLQDFLNKKGDLEKLNKLHDFVILLNDYSSVLDNTDTDSSTENTMVMNVNDAETAEISSQVIENQESELENVVELEEDEELEEIESDVVEEIADEAIEENAEEELADSMENIEKEEFENEGEIDKGGEEMENELVDEVTENEVGEELSDSELKEELNDINEEFANGEESVCLSGVEPSVTEKIEEIQQKENQEEVEDALEVQTEEMVSKADETVEINEEAKEELVSEITVNEAEEESIAQQSEEVNEDKKVKLPNIKGLQTPIFEEGTKVVQGEFFADMFPKTPKMFKLDLNDKLAFTQKLFDGSQHELNETVRTLNSFDNLDDAKVYLSDMYYEKNWEKVDEYAQRLWSLVESKFL